MMYIIIDIHDLQRMNPTDFGKPLTFSPSSIRNKNVFDTFGYNQNTISIQLSCTVLMCWLVNLSNLNMWKLAC